MSNEDRARRIAERVARRVSTSDASNTGRPENGFDRREFDSGPRQPSEPPRARVINFISEGPPVRSAPVIVQPASNKNAWDEISSKSPADYFQFVPVAQSPWHARLPAMLGRNPQSVSPIPHSADHPSQERFGIEEATVAELVEFFEKEKQCSVDPSGKPCDHCAMCSSRGF